MNKAKQYWLFLIAVFVVVGCTVWMASSDIRRFRENAPEGIVFTGMQNEHGTHGEIMDTGNQNVEHYLRKQDAIMGDMMKKMDKNGESGNASIDFMTGMIPHHESAIAMAELYLESDGKLSGLKNIAENIKTAQNKEIEQMKAKVQRLKNAGEKDTVKAEEYRKDYRRMLDRHQTGHTFSANSVDAAFAEGMIMHHQMAVDMARGILDYTDDEEVQKMARAMVAAQEQEISQMRESLKVY